MDGPSGKPWHAIPADDTLVLLATDGTKGLHDAEARSRLEFYGPNSIKQENGISAFQIFLGQFKSILVVILLIATSVSGLLGEIVDATVILVIVVLVAVTGFIQEYRAERVFAALKKRLSQTCTTIRDGQRKILDTTDLVPGDIVLLEAGTKVPADIRLVELAGLQVDESSLTGESIPVTKSLAQLPAASIVAERVNMTFAGTAVTYGRGKGVVVMTGARTEFGRIVEETVGVEEEETPLEKQVNSIGKRFGAIALGVVSIVGMAEITRETLAGQLTISGLIGVLLFGIALGVAAVPEALPAIVTATLAIGMRILARNNVLVRKMSAVETLGSTEIICFDKTGTLTKGEMTVRRVYADQMMLEVTGVGYSPDGSIKLADNPRDDFPLSSSALTGVARASFLCNDATLQRNAEGKLEVIGDPTEGALLVLARKIGLDPPAVRLQRVGEIPFSSERKLMTTVHRSEDDKLVAFMKGAPEGVLRRCSWISADDQATKWREDDKEGISKAYEEMSRQRLRVLALASKTFTSEPKTWDSEVENEFVFLGLVGMEDPLREDAIEAVERARVAGIKPVMITGDHRTTAVAIAEQAGIFKPGDVVITGEELERLSEADLAEKVEHVTVYARISPLDKLKIVGAWKKKGRVVAMTGDGVNDAPALKHADIGVAMGTSGTDVAKEAADIVLIDDNFASIVKAVELGRWIYDNIKKYLAYLLQANLVEIAVLGLIVLLVGPLMGLEEGVLPLLPVQILYINLATDGIPALALGFSPMDSDLLRKLPRSKDESVFTRDLKQFLISTLVFQVPVLVLAFITGMTAGLDAARTRLFLMLIFMELALAINCRSLSLGVRRARPHALLLLSVGWEAILIIVLIQIPGAREALHVIIPPAEDVLWVAGGVLLTFSGGEAFKYLKFGRMQTEASK